MSYAAAVDQLYALGHELAPTAPGVPRRKFDLAHMRALMAALEDPQRSFPSILIAGTNGKGSTAATLASILADAGYRAGLYTSPHLIKVNERIQLSVPTMPSEYASSDVPGSEGPSALTAISDEDFARHYFHVEGVAKRLVEAGSLPQSPSFFEVLTAVAFVYYAERKADIVVLEVGLGGRLDATNIVDPLLSVITDIALDHQEYLGSTLAGIAREKAGILRAGGTLITLPQHPEANRVFGEVSLELPGLRAISAASYMPSPGEMSVGEGELPEPTTAAGIGEETASLLPSTSYTVRVDGRPLRVSSPLRGQHQQRNVALAIAAAIELRNNFGYNIPDSAMERGIAGTRWPGRLQILRLPDEQTLLLDVAHNPAGAWTLRSAVAALPAEMPRTLLFSCLKDKELSEMTQILFPLFDGSSSDEERRKDHLVLVALENPRATALEDLLAAADRLDIPAESASGVSAAFAIARNVTPPGGLIVVSGSVYLVGAILAVAQEKMSA